MSNLLNEDLTDYLLSHGLRYSLFQRRYGEFVFLFLLPSGQQSSLQNSMSDHTDGYGTYPSTLYPLTTPSFCVSFVTS